MGEAKRRRLAAQRHPRMSIDILTGEKQPMRAAEITPTALLEGVEEFRAADARGERPEVSVPCQKCTSCCYYNHVDVDPKHEAPEHLAHLDLVEQDGGFRLRKREDGACVHLGPDGCMVYEHRPRACRGYDCRIASLASIREAYDEGRAAPVWDFDLPTPEDHAVHIAAGLGSAKFIGNSQSVDVMVKHIYSVEVFQKNFMAARKLIDMMDSLSDDERRKLGEQIMSYTQRLEARAANRSSEAAVTSADPG